MTHNLVLLTFKEYLRLAEKYILGLFKSQEMILGEFRSRESIISASDNAINGADVRARIPPIILNDLRKSCPL